MSGGENTLRACVMGWPVSHSLSPSLHGWWLKEYGIDGAYTKMPVAADDLADALKLLVERGYAGCNLTLPLKEAALPLMDAHDESCLMSGAVNTVVIRDGKLTGYNSDGFGFLESLNSANPAWDGARAVILGAGGAARGIIASLHGAGVKQFVLVNRTPEKSGKIITQFGLPAENWSWQRRHTALEDATLVVNCTSLGMEGQPPLDLDLSALPAAATVCDIVYRPLVTPLLKSAKARGNPVVEGLGMLLHQGRLGFGHWFGRDPAVTPELYAYMEKLAA